MTDAPDGPGPVEKHLAEGEAALVLVESLILALIEKGLLSPEEVAEMMDEAVQAKRAIAAEGDSPGLSRMAAGLLSRMANSFRATVPHGAGREHDG